MLKPWMMPPMSPHKKKGIMERLKAVCYNTAVHDPFQIGFSEKRLLF